MIIIKYFIYISILGFSLKFFLSSNIQIENYYYLIEGLVYYLLGVILTYLFLFLVNVFSYQKGSLRTISLFAIFSYVGLIVAIILYGLIFVINVFRRY